jgi:hypothetical protein
MATSSEALNTSRRERTFLVQWHKKEKVEGFHPKVSKTELIKVYDTKSPREAKAELRTAAKARKAEIEFLISLD